MKIVLNKDDAMWVQSFRNEDFGFEHDNFYAFRSSPKFIDWVGNYRGENKPTIVEIPDGIAWRIMEHEDGTESVYEVGHLW